MNTPMLFVVKDREDGSDCGHFLVSRGDTPGADVITYLQKAIDDGWNELLNESIDAPEWEDIAKWINDECAKHGWKATEIRENNLFY